MPFDDNEPKTPGSKIRHARTKKNLSLEALGDLCGFSRATIARIEKDEYKRFPTDIIEKLLPHLDLTMEEVKREPRDEFDHLPQYLREFIANPENTDFIEYCYLEKRRKELEAKMQNKD